MRALKCTVLFFNAALIFSIGHDALRAYALARAGMPNTLFHVAVAFDTDVPTPDWHRVMLALATPAIASALLGLAALWGYRHVYSAAAKLFLLYLGTFGAIGVLTDFTFIAWSGDLHAIAQWLEVPALLSVSVSVVSTIVFAILMWEAGRRALPPVSSLFLPCSIGTGLHALVLIPVPAVTLVNLAGGSVYWVVAIAGAFWQQRRLKGHARTVDPAAASAIAPVNLASTAITLPLLLVVIVRLLTTGVRFGG
jgi:hypothetical protein